MINSLEKGVQLSTQDRATILFINWLGKIEKYSSMILWRLKRLKNLICLKKFKKAGEWLLNIMLLAAKRSYMSVMEHKIFILWIQTHSLLKIAIQSIRKVDVSLTLLMSWRWLRESFGLMYMIDFIYWLLTLKMDLLKGLLTLLRFLRRLIHTANRKEFSFNIMMYSME